MADKNAHLLIKRYASRRLYNTESSDYVTLDDIASFIRAGRDVQIIDLKSGDDLTRQYLLQIIADHEGRGENVLPIGVLTDLVRGYTGEVKSIVPEFLAMSFDMLRNGQTEVMKNVANPITAMPGFGAMQAQQKAFLQAMTGAWHNLANPEPDTSNEPDANDQPDTKDELDDIKKQLAELQSKLSQL